MSVDKAVEEFLDSTLQLYVARRHVRLLLQDDLHRCTGHTNCP